MLKITQKAVMLLDDYFKDKKGSPIRIFAKTGGCGIRVLSIALEGPNGSDKVIPLNGYTFVVDREFIEEAQPIKVDADSVNFLISGTGFHSTAGCGNCGMMCR